jgi:carbon monoxide dehydrogenase subunit G
MRELEKQTIDWIERAPASAHGRAVSSAPPEAVFAVLADHVRWSEWFPHVRKVEVMGAASGVGARRRVHIPGAVVEEEFIVWEPGVRWSFTGTGAKPGIARALVEDCQLTATPEGGTAISYGMHIAPAPLLAPFMRFGVRALTKNLTTAMERLAARAESPPT